MSKHTPGPWQIRKTTSQSGRPMLIVERAVAPEGGINGLVALLPDRNPSASQWTPNAVLIAAGPDLLAACDAVIESLTAKHPEVASAVSYKVLGILQDAIAKARGNHG